MRYLSLFDGIGAACVAWDALGWECVGVSEIEKFPIAVTTYHRPLIPHLGDVTKITEEQIKALGLIDLIIGGFPCQDLSVAGKRKGLHNADGSQTRSGLFFDAMRIVQWAKQHCGLRYVLLENVPGLFSSNKGKDFAAVVGEMVGAEYDVPRDGWENAGAAAGPSGLVEWATLDAQYFGLAQRRKRVFVIADFGDWASRPPILLERESVSGHPPTRGEAGKEFTGATAASSTASGRDIAMCLNAGAMGRQDAESETLIPTIGSGFGFAHSLRVEGFDASEDGTARGTPIVPVAIAGNTIDRQPHNGGDGLGCDDPRSMYTLTKTDVHAAAYRTAGDGAVYEEGHLTAPLTTGTDPSANIIAFDTTQITSKANGSNPKAGDPCHPLAAGAHAPAIAVAAFKGGATGGIGYNEHVAPTLISAEGSNRTPTLMVDIKVRRLTPRECERLQGFPDDYTLVPVRGKPAADSPRYKALGNSFAVPVVRWIGQQIESTNKDVKNYARL